MSLFQPYDYQLECLGSIELQRITGCKSALAVMASGLGKTVTMAFDAKSWIETHGGRILFLCHQNEILSQSQETFEKVMGSGYSYGFYHGEKKDTHEVDCLFGSFQTISKRLRSFARNEFSYIVVDESHHSHAQTYWETLKYFTPEFLLGMTATPNRTDGNDIRLIYGEEVYRLTLVDALARGLLTPVDYRLMTDEINLAGEIESLGEKISIAKLNKKVFVPRRDEEIASIIAKNAETIPDPRTIVFCSSIDHCRHLEKFIPESVSLHSKVKRRSRKALLEMFRQGLISTILTVDCFNEGIDVPEINMVVFLRSTASEIIFHQQLGRGLRRNEGKDKVLVLDFAANCNRIRKVHKLWKEIDDRESGGSKKSRSADFENDSHPITLNVNEVNFQEKIVPILDVMENISKGFYPSWYQAGAAAKRLGISTSDQYAQEYKKDPKLPASPHQVYSNFPGWDKFLRKEKYRTWQEASMWARALGFTSKKEYEKGWKRDLRLPSNPAAAYADFPGWHTFLPGKRRLPGEKTFYSTWEKARASAVRLGIRSASQYEKAYRKDKMLPCHPERLYPDFPGWDIFLQHPNGKPLHKSLREAKRSIDRLGIKTREEYAKRHKEDPLLPADLSRAYDDYKGWKDLFGILKKPKPAPQEPPQTSDWRKRWKVSVTVNGIKVK